jgi:hypothetical protein
MSDTEKLLAIEEIKALKARYFRSVDTKDWTGLEAVFAPDLVADFRESVPERNEALLTEGAAKFVADLAPLLQHAVTVHHGHMPEIEITSDTTAKGVWAMEDKLWMPEGAPFKTLHGFGHYHETYVRLAGQWRIKTIRLTRLRIDVS